MDADFDNPKPGEVIITQTIPAGGGWGAVTYRVDGVTYSAAEWERKKQFDRIEAKLDQLLAAISPEKTGA